MTRKKMANVALLRAVVRGMLVERSRRQVVLVERVLRSEGLADVLFEHRLEMMVLTEAAGDVSGTVGGVLALLDDKVSDMDSSMSKLIDAIVTMAVEYTPEKLQSKVKGNEQLQRVAGAAKDLKEVVEWFKTLADMAKALKKAWDDSGKAEPDNLKKRLQSLWNKNKDVVKGTLEHIVGLKKLYGGNETFKAMVNAAGFEKLKEFMTKGVELAIKSIPYGGQLVAGAKMLASVAKVGGKIMDLFRKAKAAKADPQEKLAAVAKNLVRGKDENLGEFGKIFQMDDDLEAVLDDKLEAQFVEWYAKKLRELPPETPLEKANVNRLITDWIKQVYGKSNAEVGLPR
jgi:hypothetical protein